MAAGKDQSSKEKNPESSVEEFNKKLSDEIDKLIDIRKTKCYQLFLGDVTIRSALVNGVYDDLSKDYSDCNKLDVIIDSSGGDINAAYNLALLLRRYGKKKLTFIVPRWAKSAATLLACAGDEILMTPVAELGPIDPQIQEYNPLDRRIEEFSPLHIESTLELIRQEYENGNKQLADGLLGRLQFPLTLGSFKKSLDIGKQYVEKLLATGMLVKTHNKKDKISHIAKKLTSGYADHGYCINCEEAKDIGLNANELSGNALETVWEIYRIFNQRDQLMREQKKKENEDLLRNIPPDILEKVLLKKEVYPKNTNIPITGDSNL